MKFQVETLKGENIMYKTWNEVFQNGTEIKVLDCTCNQLTSLPDSIGNLINLRGLYCQENQLTSLPDSIGDLVNLERLDCSVNQLTSLPDSIGNLVNLQILDCSYNQLTSLSDSIRNLVNLQILDCYENELTSLPDSIGNLVNLKTLYCTFNQLTFLPDSIGDLVNLQILYCQENQLTSLPISIVNCRAISLINIAGNPIQLDPIIQRFIDRAENYKNHGLYSDSQNVHTSSIQKSTSESIMNLLKDKLNFSGKEELTQQLLAEPDLDNKERLFEYMDNQETHSTLLITFYDLFLRVWSRISSSPNKSDLIQRLNQEMNDAECMCFTGRLSRLVNVLVGFYPDIQIGISDNEQISSIILNIRARHELTNEDEMTDEVREEITAELKERGFTEEVINRWIL